MKIEVRLPDKIFGMETMLLKVFVLPVCLVVMFFISLSLVIRPRFEEVGVIRKERKEVAEKTKLVEEKRDYLLSVDEQELQKQADFLGKALLQEKDAYLLVGVIRKVAKDNGFYIQSFSVSPGELGTEAEESEVSGVEVTEKSAIDVVDRIPISFMVAGPKENYLDFLSAVEKTLPILSLGTFDMTTGGQMVKLGLDVVAYYIEEKSEFNVLDFSLVELMLSEEEQELLRSLSQFKDAGVGSLQELRMDGDFVEYDRPNPFSR